ncbi:DUF4810 domain-containing protein [Cupriavidus pampae]|uniref:DUF4810 domain-containing protein n=1 Tax=Cupriavidus pampae TaxID=659251 RepID=A0ABM8XH89_9BURK|nr:DUF4810 domain-containing protein [Cupriavidus pampae]CAG9179532.1 hypothetical protein LMG32289_04388 [Cupriavidus pampae]
MIKLLKSGAAMSVAIAGALALSACAPQTKYAWGSYEPALYSYYKTPGAADAFGEQLNKVITTAEAHNGKVPPGMYAEYGNILLEQGKRKDAIVFFEKEKAAWPESTVLMTRMVALANTQDSGKPRPDAPAKQASATQPAADAATTK